MHFKNYLIGAALMSLVACSTDELDQLRQDLDEQKQELTDLESELEKLKEQQDEAIAAAIASIQQQMADLEADHAAELQELTERLASEENAIYWGSVATDEAYAALTTENLAIMGNVVVRSADDLAKLQHVEVISGNIEIMSTSVDNMSLDALLTVGGGFAVNENTSLETFSAASLLGVTGDLIFYENKKLVEVGFPTLGVVEGGVYITTSLSQFDQADGVLDNADAYSFPALATIGEDLYVENAVGMGSLEMPKLSMLKGSLMVDNNTSLVELDFSMLEMIGGDFMFQYSSGDKEALLNNFEAFNMVKDIEGAFMFNYPSVSIFSAFANLETVPYEGGGIGNGIGNVNPNFGIGGPIDGSKDIVLKGFTNLALFEGFDKAENFNKVEIQISSLSSSGAVMEAFPVLRKGHVKINVRAADGFDTAGDFIIENFTAIESGSFTLDGFNVNLMFEGSDVFSNMLEFGDNQWTYEHMIDLRVTKHADEVQEMNFCPLKSFLMGFEENWAQDYVFDYEMIDYTDELNPVETENGYAIPNVEVGRDDVLSDDSCN